MDGFGRGGCSASFRGSLLTKGGLRGIGHVGRPRRGLLVWGALMAAMLALAAAGPAGASGGSVGVRPHAMGELDCNGFSPIQQAVKRTMLCRDPSIGGVRFDDHEHYIGHDEPALEFISSQPGSSSDVTWVEKLPVEPTALPTTGHPGSDITHSFELTVAPWFSMNLCDSNSDPRASVQTAIGLQRARPGPPGRRLGLHGAAVLSARLRAVRRLHQLRQHALVLGAEHRQPRVRGGRNLQRQLHRAGQLRLDSDRRRAHRPAQSAGVGLLHLHAQLPHPDDEPGRHHRHPHVRHQGARRTGAGDPRNRQNARARAGT